MFVIYYIKELANHFTLDIGLELEAYGYGTVANSKDFIIGLTTGGEGRKPKYLNE